MKGARGEDEEEEGLGGRGRATRGVEKERDPREWKIQGEMGKQTVGDKHACMYSWICMYVYMYARGRIESRNVFHK